MASVYYPNVILIYSILYCCTVILTYRSDNNSAVMSSKGDEMICVCGNNVYNNNIDVQCRGSEL